MTLIEDRTPAELVAHAALMGTEPSFGEVMDLVVQRIDTLSLAAEDDLLKCELSRLLFLAKAAQELHRRGLYSARELAAANAAKAPAND